MKTGVARTAILLGALVLGIAPAVARKIEIGKPAPDFTLRTLDGQKFKLADLRGQVVVLNFWATWCGPCKRELPLLDAAARTWQKNGLRVFAVTTETSLQPSQMKPLMNALALTPIRYIIGPYAPIEGAIPTNYVIDRNGIVRYAKAAAMDLDTLNTEVGKVLDEPAPPPAATVASN